MRSVLSRAFVACLLCFTCGVADSQSAPAPAPLTLSDAVGRALKQHPVLQGFKFTARVQEANAAVAALRPLPQLEVVVEDAAGTGERSGFSAAQTTLSLSHVIELGGKRSGRVAVAEATGAGLRTQEAAAQLDVVAEVARRFIAMLEGQHRLSVAGQALANAQKALELVERRVQAARAPPAEASRAGALVWEARLIHGDAEHDLETARHSLAAAMGEGKVQFGEAVGDLLQLPPVADFPELLTRIDSSPELLRFADEARLRDAESRLAQMRRRPDVKANLGVRRFEQGDDLALVAGITVPLFAGRTAAPHIDAARATRERVGIDRETAWLALQAKLFGEYTELEHARGLSETLRVELIPRLERALEQTAYAYERGRYSYLEWTVAQRDLLEARQRLYQAAADFHVLRIEIERLTGESLDISGVLP